MKLVLFIYLFVLSIYLAASISSGVIVGGTDQGELDLMKGKKGQRHVDIYRGLQYMCVGIASIVWVLILYSLYKSTKR